MTLKVVFGHDKGIWFNIRRMEGKVDGERNEWQPTFHANQDKKIIVMNKHIIWKDAQVRKPVHSGSCIYQLIISPYQAHRYEWDFLFPSRSTLLHSTLLRGAISQTFLRTKAWGADSYGSIRATGHWKPNQSKKPPHFISTAGSLRQGWAGQLPSDHNEPACSRVV